MNVHTTGSARVSATISFDFLANNYVLELHDADNDNLMLVGTPAVADAGRSEPTLNFANSFTAELQANHHYYIDIVEDLSSKTEVICYCLVFVFFFFFLCV